MNSDQIQARFGSYGVDVVAQSGRTRLASLYSLHGSNRICRTLALTRFFDPIPEVLKTAHTAIIAGGSIGATLRQTGWRVVKSDASFATAPAGPQFSTLCAGTLSKNAQIAIQIYTLQVSTNDQRHDYAVIAEAYHPEHIAPRTSTEDLPKLLDRLSGEQQAALTGLSSALENGIAA